MKRFFVVCVILIVAFCTVQAQNPEPAGWYSGDMHVHRSCGGSPESVPTMFNKMTPDNLAVESLLADSGNGEVQNPATDLPLVNGLDDPTVSTPSQILHWDAEWHWDATYTQYPHQALGGHIVTLGLSSATQLWQEYTFPILDSAHQNNGIAGFAHLEYLDGNGLPNLLTCCTPIEYPVEVALGASDFISEDVDDVNFSGVTTMFSETPIQAYYKLLNSGFRPGLAAGTDYPCNLGTVGDLLTYVQIPNGQLSYRDWIQGIASGRTVVSRNAHNEFLSLKVNGTSTPGDEIQLAGTGNVPVTVQWTAAQNWSGTIELVQNGVVVASLPTSAGPGAPATLTTTVNFAKSGWLAARRMGTNPRTGNYEHYLHTGAVFVVVNNAPIRASQADAQFFVDWTNGLLQNTSPGGMWNSFFPTSLAQAQARYQAAKALYQQIASEASGSGPTLNAIAVTPNNQTIGAGSQLSFNATGTYSSGPTLNVTGQVRWASSNSAVATISARGLASAVGPGSTVISATLSGKTSSTTLTVTANPLLISTTSLDPGSVGVLYSFPMAATGGTQPYAWSIASGSLPTGLTLNASSGLITGTPSAAATFNFTVRVSDSASPVQTVSKALSITVAPAPVCPCSIWPSTATPQVADGGPDSAVEVGVRFKSDLNGYITGIRFYKSTANTGTHVGNLWNSGGTKLATATFGGETASGWQQVNFSAPVAITAGTVYVASYHMTSGHYAADTNFFAGGGVDNSPLHASQDTSTTPNGVFAYGAASSFPSGTWQSANYWVDVVFSPTTGATPLTITTQSLPTGLVSAAYLASLEAIGGTTPYAWSIASGSLPTGLTLSANGMISGTPSAVGTSNFVVQASDLSSPAKTATQGLSITVTTASGNCPCSIWPSTAVPQQVDSGPDSSVELGTQFTADVSGYISGIRFYKSAANTGTHVGNLWNADGAQLATATFTGESASGWQEVDFSAPVPITAGTVYVASYHATSGHYSGDGNYFANQGVDNAPLHALQDTANGHNGVYSYGAGDFPNQAFSSTNYWVDVVFTPAPDTAPPTVLFVDPAAGASGIDPLGAVTATFSEELNASTVNGSSVQLLGPSSSLIAATVTYSPGSDVATLTPTNALLNSTTYTVVLKGGIIKDVPGNALASDYSWSFTTSPPTLPPTGGPGGPILIVSSTTNPFSGYYAEILRNEGFNEFTTMDVTQVSASTLANYDVVVLGNFALTAAQVSTFTTWVNNGGNLIAMRPDKQLASTLGLTDARAVLNDAYLLINTASDPGSGLVSDTIQFHGSADRYTLNGATSLATLYSSAAASTSNPAVTLKQTGLGQAAAFTYDLARSVVYTRQGNPAWSGQSRDGQSGPIRSDNLFFGNATSDPQPDYVDRNKIAIPQADEQQRLLANLIIQMNIAKKPLPRFWYFPHNFKAAVVLTGDDHGGGGAATRMEHYISLSTPGCSVDDWECVRASDYTLAPSISFNPLTSAQAAAYAAQGFEFGVHVDSVPDCINWTSSQLHSFYPSQITSFLSKYTSMPRPKTHRMHCVSWSDYDSQPQVELQNGIRVDTTYYYWPAAWVNDVPGIFTGSGMPMRFTKMDGTMLDIYQAATQMTDESGQTFPLHVDTLLDNALGPKAYYGFFTANMHTDVAMSEEGDAIIASAQARGVPIISAAQLLTWLDGRNGSSFTSLAWNGSTLTFGIAVGAGANGLQAMLPASLGSAALQSVTLDGSPIGLNLATIKGISYAVFPASAGAYQATYATTSGVNIASVTMNPSPTVGGNPTTGTVSLSGPAPTGGAQISLKTSDTATTSLSSSTVTVPEGATTATFTVNTNVVTATRVVVISATYSSITVSSNLTITPVATVTSLTLNPITVLGGASSTATVTLHDPAPSGGVVVNLTSSNTAAAQVPVTVNIGAGATTATFTVSTTPVVTDASLTISATIGTTQQTASFTVTAAALGSVTLNPTSVSGGTNSTGTVTLNGPAPAGGALVTLSSSNTAAAQVPASVTVSAGQSSATFAVTTSPVASNASLTISATYGSTQTASLTVTAAVVLNTITLNPTSVLGGVGSTGTLTLSGPAPAGGARVTLSSSNTAAAQVPASVTVAANATTAIFAVTTTPVSSNASVTISGIYGSTKTASLTVTASVLNTVTLNPTTVPGGASSTGTVTLSGRAPAGGVLVTLSSSNTAAAQVSASVTVPANSTTATFTVTSSVVSANTTATITAIYNATRTATVTVVPGLSTVTLNPTSVVGGNSSTGTLTLSGAAPTGGAVVTLSSNNTAAAQVPASVTVAAGATTATFTVTTSGVASSASVTITGTYGVARTSTLTVTPATLTSVVLSPTSLVGGNSSTGTVTLTGRAPTGGAVVTLSSSNTSAAQVPASVTVAAGATTATFTTTTFGVASSTSATITATYSVAKTATLTVTPATLTSVALNPTSVTGATSSTGTVTLTGRAPAGGAVVTLSSNNTAAAQVPASVTVTAGATTATFTVTTSAVVSSASVTITGTYGVARTGTLTVIPPAVTSVVLNPTSVIGGLSSTGTVRLTGPAPAAGIVVTLSSNNTAAAQVPTTVTVAAGATTATFTVTTSPVASNASVTITGTYGVARTGTLTVQTPVATSLTLNPSTVKGGSLSTGTVSLSGPAPSAGAVVTLSSSQTSVATVPASVTVTAGNTTATFTVTTRTVTFTRTTTISATKGGTVTAVQTVTP